MLWRFFGTPCPRSLSARKDDCLSAKREFRLCRKDPPVSLKILFLTFMQKCLFSPQKGASPNDVFDMAKVEAGCISVENDPINLGGGGMERDVTDLMRMRAGRNHSAKEVT